MNTRKTFINCILHNCSLFRLSIVTLGIPNGFRKLFMFDVNRHELSFSSIYSSVKHCLFSYCDLYSQVQERESDFTVSNFSMVVKSLMNELFGVIGSYCFYYESMYSSPFLFSRETLEDLMKNVDKQCLSLDMRGYQHVCVRYVYHVAQHIITVSYNPLIIKNPFGGFPHHLP